MIDKNKNCFHNDKNNLNKKYIKTFKILILYNYPIIFNVYLKKFNYFIVLLDLRFGNVDPRRFRLTHQTSFGKRHLNHWSNNSVLFWLVSSIIGVMKHNFASV